MIDLERFGIQPLIHLPESFKHAVFLGMGLSLNEKLVLASLFYLDSLSRLREYRCELQRFLAMDWAEVEACMKTLAGKGLIAYTSSGLLLRVKPLTYDKTRHAKTD